MSDVTGIKMKFQAGSFFAAYNTLCSIYFQSDNQKYLTPMIVNGAFTAELAIKAILHETQIDFGKEHNLMYLFKLLPEDIALDIINRSMAKAEPYRNITEWINQLFAIAQAFETWRYSAEAQHHLAIDVAFLQSFVQAAYGALTAKYGEVDFEKETRTESVEHIDEMIEEAQTAQKEAVAKDLLKIEKKRKRR